MKNNILCNIAMVVRFSHLQLANICKTFSFTKLSIWQIFHSSTLPIFGTYSLLHHWQYLEDILIFNLPTIGNFSPLQQCQYVGNSPLQHCQYLANILLCNIANIWEIFSSATCQHLEKISSATLPILCKYSFLHNCQWLADILLCNIANIWQLFISSTLPILGQNSTLQHCQYLADTHTHTVPIGSKNSFSAHKTKEA